MSLIRVYSLFCLLGALLVPRWASAQDKCRDVLDKTVPTIFISATSKSFHEEAHALLETAKLREFVKKQKTGFRVGIPRPEGGMLGVDATSDDATFKKAVDILRQQNDQRKMERFAESIFKQAANEDAITEWGECIKANSEYDYLRIEYLPALNASVIVSVYKMPHPSQLAMRVSSVSARAGTCQLLGSPDIPDYGAGAKISCERQPPRTGPMTVYVDVDVGPRREIRILEVPATTGNAQDVFDVIHQVSVPQTKRTGSIAEECKKSPDAHERPPGHTTITLKPPEGESLLFPSTYSCDERVAPIMKEKGTHRCTAYLSRQLISEASDGSSVTVVFKNRSHSVRLCVRAETTKIVIEPPVEVAGGQVAFGQDQAAIIMPPPYTVATILRQRGSAINNDLILGQSAKLQVQELKFPSGGPIYSVTYHP